MPEKIRIAIFTARNLMTSSDCSPGTIKNLLDVINPETNLIDIIFVDKFIPPALHITEDELLKLPVYVPFDTVLKHPNISQVISLENMTFNELCGGYDLAIVAIYNDLGEDGKILGLLDLLGIPYISPSLKVSVVCFDKSYTRILIQQGGCKVPPGFLIHLNNYYQSDLDYKIKNSIGYPAMIKAASSGNSYGVSLVHSVDEIAPAVSSACKFSEEFLVEKYILGQEYTVGVMGSYLNPIPLPVVQINSKNEFFDFDAKYSPGKAVEVCPAPIGEDLKIKLQKNAVDAYIAVKCDSHARIDMIYGKDGEVYILDINTFPGLNSASLFPQELKAMGSSLSDFLDQQIKLKSKKS